MIMRWESNVSIDMDLRAWFEPIHKEVYFSSKEFILDDNNRAWLDQDFTSHFIDGTRESQPEIITILGKPSSYVKVYVRNFNKELNTSNQDLKEDVTVEIFKKETNGKQILLNKFSVAGSKFTGDNYDIDFCTIDLETGTITKCEGVENAI